MCVGFGAECPILPNFSSKRFLGLFDANWGMLVYQNVYGLSPNVVKPSHYRHAHL